MTEQQKPMEFMGRYWGGTWRYEGHEHLRRWAAYPRAVLELFLEEGQKIAAGGRLTELGQQEELRKLAQEEFLTKKLRGVRDALETNKERLADLRKDLTPLDPADPSDARAAMYELRILDRLERMDHHKRIEFIQKAVKTRNEPVLRAVLEDPMELVTPEYRALVEKTLIQARHGKKLEEAEVLEGAIAEVERNLGNAEAVIREVAGLEGGDGGTWVPGSRFDGEAQTRRRRVLKPIDTGEARVRKAPEKVGAGSGSSTE